MPSQPSPTFIPRHSFIVRVWRAEGTQHWQAWVQYVRTGEERCTRDLAEIMAFIAERADLAEGEPPAQAHLK